MASLDILKALQSGNLSIEEAKQQIKKSSQAPAAIINASPHKKESVAIVGMSGRYPDAADLAQYWGNLAAGKNSIKEIPASRWDVNDYFDPRPYQKGKTYSKWLGALDEIECFDPLFFSIPPVEAELMDPQHRIFLQEAHKAFEDAGYNNQSLSNKKCGVYLGIMSFEYGLMLHGHKSGIAGTIGNSYSIAAARIAYHLNLKGPAIALDTACSSSLVAIHLACQALLNHETDMALAGGVSLYLTPESYMSMCSAGMLSKDGQCKTLDAKADGFVPGEGAGAVVLKRLSDAIADNDSIHGVIVGSGINQDGKTNGITAPSVNSQIDLEKDVYSRYTIDPESINYVEMHGTGTKLGDPIELEALSTVYREYTQKRNYCALGSVKSNIGHTSAAAGVASVHKVLLSIKHKKMAPTLNVQVPTAHFDFNTSPFYINHSLKDWELPVGPKRRAAVSSFGFSGTNAHLVIEEFVEERMAKGAASVGELIILSAKSPEQLDTYAINLAKYLKTEGNITLTDLAYTLQVGRNHMEHRLAVVARSVGEAIELLESFLEKKPSDNIKTGFVQHPDEDEVLVDTDEVLSSTYRRQQLKRIAGLWVEGKTIQWPFLYKDNPKRTSLPTYPFAKEWYWLPEESETPETIKENPEKRIPKFLKKEWVPEDATTRNRPGQKVILYCTKDTENLADELMSHFTSCQIILDEHSGPFELPEEEWKNYDGWIDLVGCGRQKSNSDKWLPLLQQIIEYGSREGLKIMGVSKGMEPFKNEAVNLAGADRVGLYRMLQNEYRYLNSLHMDLDPNGTDTELARQIADGFYANSNSPEICIREDVRYRALLSEQSMDVTRSKKITFSTNEVLWITGGTRGIGLLCARHFVENYGARKLVLSGREKIPPRHEWGMYLKQGTSISKKVKAIQELEALGAKVHVTSVSLTDLSAVKKEIKRVNDDLGEIAGFIHSAGIVNIDNPAFIRKSLGEINEVRAVKTGAVDVLYSCFKGQPLKFFVMFSSVAAIVPSLGAGQGDYAMANAYMDYVAGSYGTAFPVLSIQWASWKETGFGEVKSTAYGQTGFLSQTNEEGLMLLDIVLNNNCNGAILPVMVDKRKWHPEQLLQLPVSPSPQNTKVSARDNGPISSIGPSELVDNVQKLLIEILSKELKMDPGKINVNTQFQLFGIDSIILAQLVVKIDQALDGVKLDPAILIEHSTIHSLGQYLINNYPKELDKLYNGRVSTSAPVLSSPGTGLKESSGPEKVAIIGMACHFPGAANIQEFWNNLKSGKDCMSRIPPLRWDESKYYDPQGKTEGKSACNRGGFISNIEDFDPTYFKISESLAPFIDPLQRQWLEVSAEAMADAGLITEEWSGKNVGVFAGARTSNFGIKYPQQVKDRIVGIGQNFIAAHLSHIYNFRGPNMVIDTACSSTLTAIHQAVRSILYGESEIALAGGVDILLDEGLFVGLSDAKILSPEGRCKTFDAGADGIGLGEGCGVLVLKPLQKAIQDNNKIYAVIDGSAINNDGNTMGITTPNPDAQSDLIENAIRNAKIDPETISYVEAHGTGTLIGDPIELKGLTRVLDKYTAKKQFCGVGSVKSNMGHLLSAAGAASIIKVALSMAHAHLPPTVHCHTPNPRFNFSTSPLYLVQDFQKWEPINDVLRAGISAFGLGGNNAHIIISNEGVPGPNRASMEPVGEPVVFNRKTYWPTQLAEKATSYQKNEPFEINQEDGFMKFFEIEEVQ